MDIGIPEFLSKDFLKKSLENGFKTENIQIKDFQISRASAIGENYMSTVYRVKVQYQLSNKEIKSISLIVKSMLMEMYKLEEFDAFYKEVEMYQNILPGIENLYGNKEIFVPKCFYVENTETHQCIVLEDLTTLGYTLCDRIKRLDEDHCKIVLQKLGRFHAGSIVLTKKNPEIFKPFDKGFYQPKSVKSDPFKGMFCSSLEQLLEFVEKWDGFDQIAQKLKNILNNFEIKCTKELERKPNEIRVLNHCDLWTNNLMFKYENGNISSFKFIDLQICTNDSLGLDINYFFNTSVGYEVIKNKRNELIECYYESLCNALKELKYPEIPTLKNVYENVESRNFFGFLISIGIAPIIMLDREESKDSTFETLIDKNELGRKKALVFSNPKFADYMKYSLKRLNDLKVLDL